MNEEAEPGVERDPAEDKVELILDGEETVGDDEVHEPWSEVCWVGAPKSFVGHEDWEEDGYDRARWKSC